MEGHGQTLSARETDNRTRRGLKRRRRTNKGLTEENRKRDRQRDRERERREGQIEESQCGQIEKSR